MRTKMPHVGQGPVDSLWQTKHFVCFAVVLTTKIAVLKKHLSHSQTHFFTFKSQFISQLISENLNYCLQIVAIKWLFYRHSSIMHHIVQKAIAWIDNPIQYPALHLTPLHSHLLTKVMLFKGNWF